MAWKDRELQSPEVLRANLTNNEKEIIKLAVNSAIKEQINPNGRWQYFDGIQTGIAQVLRLMDRLDLLEFVACEFPYHDELN